MLIDHPQELRTPRLILRRWRAADHDAFAAMNSDPVVMQHFPAIMSQVETTAAIARIEAHFQRHGYGLWAVEIPNVTSFAGFVGLNIPGFQTHFTPCHELGWRLAAEHWGQGFATEGARAAVRFAFEALALAQIVSYTAVENLRSRRVMEKLGMTHNPHEDFAHPLLPAEHRLSRHVLYRLARDQADEGCFSRGQKK